MGQDVGIRARVRNKWRRLTTEHLARRNFRLDSAVPLVSFTFDDFPRSAFTVGRLVLEDHGVRGTYFVSLQLLGRPSVSGTIASRPDLETLLRDGHELGCHTFEHLDGRRSTLDAFEHSIAANRRALEAIAPRETFSVFAYPLDGPVVGIKRAVGRHFMGCRGGGQSFNSGVMDLNLLKAYFLDWRNRNDFEAVRQVIDANAASRGWLIFATHDVANAASKYGCEPRFFADVVRYAVQSGARVLPMGTVCQELKVDR